MNPDVSCRYCGGAFFSTHDFGSQPVSSRYLTDKDQAEKNFPMVLGVCGRCGILQIATPVPPADLRPVYDWVAYIEPESHLDDLSDAVTKLDGVGPKSAFVALTATDFSTIRRIKAKGYANAFQIDPKEDLGISQPSPGLETLQERLTPERARTIAARRGRADVLVVRRILEHAHHPGIFLESIKHLVADDGVVVFEVPDSTRALDELDYTMIWEDHVCYLTPSTFEHLLASNGFEILWRKNYPFPVENSLICIARRSPTKTPAADTSLDADRRKADAYLKSFSDRKTAVQTALESIRASGRSVAVFGAGHTSCVFINLMEIKEKVRFVADDSENKKGKFMPGSRLPIVSSDNLIKSGPLHCLLALSPEVQPRVVAKNQTFLSQGGTFGSIFSIGMGN